MEKWNKENESNIHCEKFKKEDRDKGPIVNDSQFGPVIHINSSCCITPSGVKLYEW